MSRKNLRSLIGGIMDEVQPRSEHVDSPFMSLMTDPCLLKDWLLRIVPKVTIPFRYAVQFIASTHSGDATAFEAWLGDRGITLDPPLTASILLDRVARARTLACVLSTRYLTLSVCEESGLQKLRKAQLRDRIRGRL